MLVISTETGYNKWACNSCAYEFPITKQVIAIAVSSEMSFQYATQMTARTHLKRKDVDDVLGGEDHWKHADSTSGVLSSINTLLHILTACCLNSSMRQMRA
jgi:DNA-directed RNA polymerase III subunit RPC11